jgi:hypothetical protein
MEEDIKKKKELEAHGLLEHEEAEEATEEGGEEEVKGNQAKKKAKIKKLVGVLGKSGSGSKSEGGHAIIAGAVAAPAEAHHMPHMPHIGLPMHHQKDPLAMKMHVLPDTYCFPFFKFLHEFEHVIMAPLIWLDEALVHMLGGGKAAIIKAKDAKIKELEAELGHEKTQQMAQMQDTIATALEAEEEMRIRNHKRHHRCARCLYIICMGESTTRICLTIINLLMMCVGLTLVAQGLSVYEHDFAKVCVHR